MLQCRALFLVFRIDRLLHVHALHITFPNLLAILNLLLLLTRRCLPLSAFDFGCHLKFFLSYSLLFQLKSTLALLKGLLRRNDEVTAGLLEILVGTPLAAFSILSCALHTHSLRLDLALSVFFEGHTIYMLHLLIAQARLKLMAFPLSCLLFPLSKLNVAFECIDAMAKLCHVLLTAFDVLLLFKHHATSLLRAHH